MSIKIRKDGIVQDLVINATEVQVLDLESNFRSKNLESILKEIKATGGGSGTGGGMLKEAEYVFVGDKEPEFEGVWLDTSENNNELEGISDNGIVKELKSYVDKDIKDASYSKEKLLNDEIVNLDTDTQKQLKVTTIKGKTIINLLGKDGNCEDISKWENFDSIHELNSENKAFGNNGFKVTINSIDKVCGIYKNVTNLIDKSKYYCLSAYLKNSDLDNLYYIQLSDNKSYAIDSKLDISKKDFQRLFLKYDGSEIVESSSERFIYVAMKGTKTCQYGYIDGIMLEEITEEQYNDPNFKPSEYANSDMSVGEIPTKIKTVGKNKLDLVQGSYIDYNAKYACNISRVTHKDGAIAVKPNTAYSISLSKPLAYRIVEYDSNKNVVIDNPWSSQLVYNCSFVSNSLTSYVCVAFKINDSTALDAENYKIQLEEGNKSTEYKPYKETYMDIPVLRSLPNGICDEYIEGNFIKRVEKIILNGNSDWIYNAKQSNFKEVFLKEFIKNGVSGEEYGLKFNNKILQHLNSFSNDSVNLQSNGNLLIRIPNEDSGWGENYNPTQEEIKAYFYGWKMSTDQGNSYNGTGVKCWTPFSRVGMNTDSQLTLPTGYSKYTFTPYRLYYQLATPIIKELNQPQLMIEPNGQLQVESDKESWVRPNNGVAYIIADNVKANLDEVEYGVYKNSKEINSIDKRINTISNPNLLINPDFRIWQRGTSFESGVYTTDRWMLKSDTKAVAQKTDNGIRITAKQDGNWTNFSQFIEKENLKKLKGQTLTLTFKTTQPTNMVNQIWGVAIGGKYIFNRYFSENEYSDIFSVTFKLDEIRDVTEIGIQLRSKAGVTIELEYAKLEVGDKVTPFVSRNCGKELALCQRYYEVMPRLIGHTSYGIDFIRGFWYFREQKRTTPTIKYSFNGIENEIGYVDRNVGKIFQKSFANNGSYTDKDMFCLEGCLGITNYFQWEAKIIADSEIYI